MGLGRCVRNREGAVLFALASYQVGTFSFIRAELEAIAVSLASAISLGYTIIVVESDSKGVIDLIMSGNQCFNELGSVLEDIASFGSNVDAVFLFCASYS